MTIILSTSSFTSSFKGHSLYFVSSVIRPQHYSMVVYFNMLYDLVRPIEFSGTKLEDDIGDDDDNEWWVAFFQDG